jgi:glutamate-1-semialdehyde aminotransferase
VVASRRGARFTDIDGNTCLDFFVADHSAFYGHAPAYLRAVT